MVSSDGGVVSILNNLLDGGKLVSQTADYLETKIRHPYRKNDSWYGEVFDQKGEKGAEEALEAWAKRLYLREFSEAIVPTVRGIRDLAKADKKEKYTKLIDLRASGTRNITFSLSREMYNEGILIVAFNPEHRGCGCTVPDGYDVFGGDGTLSLKAVVLGHSFAKTKLALVLRNFGKENSFEKIGFTSITVDLAGYMSNETCAPYISSDKFLRYSLGLENEAFGLSTFAGGSEDICMGFPGSADYLAKHIGKLGPYLSATAAKLKEGHKH